MALVQSSQPRASLAYQGSKVKESVLGASTAAKRPWSPGRRSMVFEAYSGHSNLDSIHWVRPCDCVDDLGQDGSRSRCHGRGLAAVDVTFANASVPGG